MFKVHPTWTYPRRSTSIEGNFVGLDKDGTVVADVPYNVVDVLLDEGVHFQSQVLDCPPEEIHEGLAVEAVFVPVDEDITLVKFRRVD